MKTSYRLLILLLVLLSVCACARLLMPKVQTQLASLRPGAYTLDKQHATLLFKVGHLGLSTFVGRFNVFDATLDFDAKNIVNSRLDAVVEMASVDVNNADFANTLRSASWFDVDVYPQARFTTTSVKVLPSGHAAFSGDLTFLGKTQTVVLKVKFNGGANNMLTGRYTIGFSAEADFARSAFGLDKYIPMIGDQTQLEVHAEFQLRSKR